MEPLKTVRLWFEKTGRAKYISHLDLVRCVTRALKRSGLPVWYTQGFNPHIYLTFALPLSLGQESCCEIMQFRLVEEVEMQEVARRLDVALPEELRVRTAYDASEGRDFTKIAAARYQLRLQGDKKPLALASALQKFVEQSAIITSKKTKKGIKEVDIRPMLLDAEVRAEKEVCAATLRCAAGTQKNLNPALLLDAFCTQTGCQLSVQRIFRDQLYDTEGALFR